MNDLAESIFAFGSESYGELVKKIWLDTFSMAANSDVKGIVMTICYAKTEDDAFIKKIVRIVEKKNGSVCLVLLTCDEKTLYKRVVSDSRKKFGKIKNVEVLKKMMTKYDLLSPISFVKGVQVDTTKLSAKRTIEQKYKVC